MPEVSPAPTPYPSPAPGRVVHLYGEKWEGPRPGIIIKYNFPGSDNDDVIGFVDVNILLHGQDDQPLLTSARISPSGNTLLGVPLFGGRDNPENLHDEIDTWGKVYAIWPPKV